MLLARLRIRSQPQQMMKEALKSLRSEGGAAQSESQRAQCGRVETSNCPRYVLEHHCSNNFTLLTPNLYQCQPSPAAKSNMLCERVRMSVCVCDYWILLSTVSKIYLLYLPHCCDNLLRVVFIH